MQIVSTIWGASTSNLPWYSWSINSPVWRSTVSRHNPIAYTSPLTRRWMPVPKIRSVPSGVSVNLSNPRSEVWIDAYGLVSVSLRLGWLVTSRVLPALSRNSVTRMCPVVDTVTGKPQASVRSGSTSGSHQSEWSLDDHWLHRMCRRNQQRRRQQSPKDRKNDPSHCHPRLPARLRERYWMVIPACADF